MKTRLLLALALLASAPALSAQQGPPPGGRGPGMMNMAPEERASQRVALLAERLALTPQQKAQIEPLLVKQFTVQRQRMQSLMQGGGDRQAAMQEMREMREKNDAEILALLTAEQKPKYEALVKEEAARRPGGPGGPPRQR